MRTPKRIPGEKQMATETEPSHSKHPVPQFPLGYHCSLEMTFASVCPACLWLTRTECQPSAQARDGGKNTIHVMGFNMHVIPEVFVLDASSILQWQPVIR